MRWKAERGFLEGRACVGGTATCAMKKERAGGVRGPRGFAIAERECALWMRATSQVLGGICTNYRAQQAKLLDNKIDRRY